MEKDILFLLNILLGKLLPDPSLANNFNYKVQKFGQFKVVDYCRWLKIRCLRIKQPSVSMVTKLNFQKSHITT